MKPAAFTGFLMLLVATASAQLTLLPQMGFERSKTSISYNDLSSFSPLGGQTFLNGSIKLDYRFKKGHSPYLAFGTHPPVVSYSFSNPSDLSDARASTGSMQWHLEAGYQFSSKPIVFKKAQSKKSSAAKPQEQRTCRSYYGHCCGQHKAQAAKQSSVNLRLQPSIGIAYLPSINENMVKSASGYQYNAGNANTAVVAGMGFELGKGRDRIMTLGFTYTKGIGNLGTQEITTYEGTKPVVNKFSSSTSSWGLTLGVPFTLTHQHHSKPALKSKQQPSCQARFESCHYRCIRRI
jgi:hypothetical protein